MKMKAMSNEKDSNSVRVVLLNALYLQYMFRFPYSQLGTSCVFESPTLASEVSLRGEKQTHEMNPERVQLFLIYHVIGRNKTRTGFEIHMLSLPRGRLVPRQPRAFKSITATQLRCRLISHLSSYHTFKSITAMQLLHEKCLNVQHNIHCHPQERKSGQPNMALIARHNIHCHRIIIDNPQNNIYPII